MVFNFFFFVWITTAFALENDIRDCIEQNVSNVCTDQEDATSFLQMSMKPSRGSKARRLVKTRDGTWKASKVEPIDCMVEVKPFQIMKEEYGFSWRDLDVNSGRYITRKDFPFEGEETIPGGYADLNACGLNPADNITYCILRAEGMSYAARMDMKGNIEYVAKLPTLIWSAAAFSRKGSIFVSTHSALFVVIDDMQGKPGFEDRDDREMFSIISQDPIKPKGWLFSADTVVLDYEEYAPKGIEFVLAIYGPKFQLAKWDSKKRQFTDSWITKVIPARWDNIFGAGWIFGQDVFFATNRGAGVYKVPLDNLDLDHPENASKPWDMKQNVTLELIGRSEWTTFNDGFNCIDAANPWAGLGPPKVGEVLQTITTTTTTATTTTTTTTTTLPPVSPRVPEMRRMMSPFGKEATAKQLQGHAARTQDVLVDAMENAQVAELKRTIYRSLTRLRSAQVKEFDTVARLEVKAMDDYNDRHHYRIEHPLKHLHAQVEPEVWADKYTSWDQPGRQPVG